MGEPLHTRVIRKMTIREYQEDVRRTSPGYETNTDQLYHAVFGLTSEAGEVAGILQKLYQGHELDRMHIIKELGDCLWMISEACDALETDLETVMTVNVEKRKARYPDGFSADRSLHRAEEDI